MPRRRDLVLLCLALAWFNWGLESLRTGGLDRLAQNPTELFSPPWLALRAFVSRDGDERLYWEYSRLALGQQADLDYLAEKRLGDAARDRQDIASRVRPGPRLRLPYRDFGFEYPPLALAPMLVPRVLASDLPSYRLAYGLGVAALVLATGLVGAGLANTLGVRAPPHTWKRLALYTLAIGPILVGRFDVLPALLVALALWALLAGREFGAGMVMGAAVLAKLYPLLLAIPWLALLWREGGTRRPLRFAGGLALSMSALSAPFLVLAPRTFLQSTFAYGARPFQIESTVGALMVLLRGREVVTASFGSFNVRAPAFVDALWSLALPLTIAAAVLAIVRPPAGPGSFRDPAPERRRSDLATRGEVYVTWTTAAVVWILVTSKVLSPQFLIWLLPLCPLVTDGSGWAGALAAAVLTQIVYPYLYDPLVEDGNRWVAALVVIRNGLLVYVGWRLFRAALASWRGGGMASS
jgi:glycosyl transferase family 87